MKMPVVFIHKGYSDYMEYSLRQARAVCPEEVEIILLGDKRNDCFDFVTHVDMDNFTEKSDAFEKVYKHHSTNGYAYEIFCIQRWFVLEEYMRSRGLDAAFVIDTDIMLYQYPQKMMDLFLGKYQLSGIHIQGTKEYSCSQSFWKYSLLKDFTDDLFRIFQSEKRLAEHLEKYFVINDMVLFTNFMQNADLEKKTMNLLEIFDGETTDPGLAFSSGSIPKEYKMTIFKRKKIKWKENIPHSCNTRLKCDILFVLLHFQGAAKYAMSSFYRGSAFSRKRFLDTKFYFADKAAWIYGNFISPVRYSIKMFFLTKH